MEMGVPNWLSALGTAKSMCWASNVNRFAFIATIVAVVCETSLLAGSDAADVGTTPAFGKEVTSVRMHLPSKASPLTRRIGGILAGRIQEYSGARAATSGKGQLHVHLFLRSGIGVEGFEIQGGRAR